MYIWYIYILNKEIISFYKTNLLYFLLADLFLFFYFFHFHFFKCRAVYSVLFCFLFCNSFVLVTVGGVVLLFFVYTELYIWQCICIQVHIWKQLTKTRALIKQESAISCSNSVFIVFLSSRHARYLCAVLSSLIVNHKEGDDLHLADSLPVAKSKTVWLLPAPKILIYTEKFFHYFFSAYKKSKYYSVLQRSL